MVWAEKISFVILNSFSSFEFFANAVSVYVGRKIMYIQCDF